MKRSYRLLRFLQLSALLLIAAGCAQLSTSSNADPLSGTAWQLVRFESSDDSVLVPTEGAQYRLTFAEDRTVAVQLDCNRGRSTWKSDGPSHLEFGPLALTRAMCRSMTLHDHLVKQWPYVRSYVIRDGHLYIALMADGGIYEFKPIPGGAESDKGK